MASPPFIVAFSGHHAREESARAAGCGAFVLKLALDRLIAIVVQAGTMLAAAAEGMKS